MHFDITPDQRNLLLQLVDEAMRDIGPEIRHTDSHEFRDDLKLRRTSLRDLHALLVQQGLAAADSDTNGLWGTP